MMPATFAIRNLQRLFLLCVCSAGWLHAQQTNSAPDSPAYTLKTSVNRVLVDVTVTDNHGDSVHGLTKDDFLIEEDGKSQALLSFDSYNFDKGMDYVPPKLPALAPGTFVNLPPDPERGPLYVLFYDLVNIPQEEQIYARAQLVKFIEAKPVGARIAILVSSDGVHLVQGFTSDKAKLMAAVDVNGTGPHVPKVFLMGGNFGQGDRLATSVRLNSIARYLAPMDGRKVLVWFASQFPLSFFPSWTDTGELQKEARKTLNLFADDQIALYPVDVSGVVLNEAYGAPGDGGGGAGINVDSRDKGLSPVAAPGPTANTPPVPGTPSQNTPSKGPGASLTYASYLTQDAIAQMTGGQAIYSSNNLKGSLEKVTEEAGSYYTLGYSPSNETFDGSLRKIEVKLKEGKYRLSYRRAYYGTRAGAAGDELAEDKLSESMKHGAPDMHQLVFEAHLEPAGSPQRGTKEQMLNIAKSQGGKDSAKAMKPIPLQVYTVDYAVMAKQLRANGDTDPQFELAAAAFDADGNLLNSMVNTTQKTDPGAGSHPLAKDLYRVEQELDAPLDAKFIRLAVRDTRTGKVGAMEIALPLVPAK